MHTTKFMCISPAGCLSGLFVDKCHILFRCGGRDQTGEEVFLYLSLIGRIHLQFHGFICGQKLELRPGFCQLFFQLYGGHIVE